MQRSGKGNGTLPIHFVIKLKKVFFLLSVCAYVSCCNTNQQPAHYIDHEYWKNQALTDILPYWTKYAVDTAQGAFFCILDGNWKPEGDIKFPSMIARHLFSYSAAYLMSGDDAHLNRAIEIKKYLLAHAWDNQHGGWFDALSAAGEPLHLTKSTFVQVYVTTGLTMYYFVTRDPEVLDFVNRSNKLLEDKAWDHNSGGYFDAMERDWTPKSEIKSLSSQLAPVSGYLLYLYLATRDKEYLEQAERITDAILQNMVDTTTGWVLETFDKDWKYIPGKEDEAEINIGHNIELAWTLLRLNLLNIRTDYLKTGKDLANQVHDYGFNEKTGFWYASIGNSVPELHSRYTYWWIQAYGNMLDLCLQRIDDNPEHMSDFNMGAAFWDKHFLDREKGDTHLSVLENGDPQEIRKATQFKASYHSVEYCMLNYFYLANWVNRKPIRLYFKLAASAESRRLYPLPIENPNASIREVTFEGKQLSVDASNPTYATVPPHKKGALVVILD